RRLPGGFSCQSRPESDPRRGRQAHRLLFFRGSGSRPAGADGGAIDAPQVEVDESLLVQLPLERLQDAVEQTAATHLGEAVVDRLPVAVALGQITPGGAGVQPPEDAVEDGAIVLPLAAPAAGPRRKEGSQ